MLGIIWEVIFCAQPVGIDAEMYMLTWSEWVNSDPCTLCLFLICVYWIFRHLDYLNMHIPFPFLLFSFKLSSGSRVACSPPKGNLKMMGNLFLNSQSKSVSWDFSLEHLLLASLSILFSLTSLNVTYPPCHNHWWVPSRWCMTGSP